MAQPSRLCHAPGTTGLVDQYDQSRFVLVFYVISGSQSVLYESAGIRRWARVNSCSPPRNQSVVPGNGAGTVPSERFKSLVKSPGKSFLRSGGLRRAVALTLGL